MVYNINMDEVNREAVRIREEAASARAVLKRDFH